MTKYVLSHNNAEKYLSPMAICVSLLQQYTQQDMSGMAKYIVVSQQ